MGSKTSPPSQMVSQVYTIREQAPVISCSQPPRKVFKGMDHGVSIRMRDTSRSTILYTLYQPGDERPESTPARVINCGSSNCEVFLPSFCPHPMTQTDSSTIGIFGKFYPEGCAYVLKAWAESATRPKGPEFVGRYLVVPNPVAEKPVFTTSIKGVGVEESTGRFVIAPGASVTLKMACGGGTQPRYSTGAPSDPTLQDPLRERLVLDKGAQVYKASLAGPKNDEGAP